MFGKEATSGLLATALSGGMIFPVPWRRKVVQPYCEHGQGNRFPQ